MTIYDTRSERRKSAQVELETPEPYTVVEKALSRVHALRMSDAVQRLRKLRGKDKPRP